MPSCCGCAVAAATRVENDDAVRDDDAARWPLLFKCSLLEFIGLLRRIQFQCLVYFVLSFCLACVVDDDDDDDVLLVRLFFCSEKTSYCTMLTLAANSHTHTNKYIYMNTILSFYLSVCICLVVSRVLSIYISHYYLSLSLSLN